MTKIADLLTPYEKPPEISVNKDDVRIWREHYIYNVAEADAFKTLLQLFGGQMSDELKEWLVGAEKARRSEAIEADEKSKELNMKLWKEFRG